MECVYETARPDRGPETTTLSTHQRRDVGGGCHPEDTSDQIPHTSQTNMSTIVNGKQHLQRNLDQNPLSFMNNATQNADQSMDQSFDQTMPQSFMQQPVFVNFDNIDFNSNLDWILHNTNTDDGIPAPDLEGLIAYDHIQAPQSRFMSAPQTATPSSPQSMIGDETLPGHAAEPADLSPLPKEKGKFEDPWPVDTARPSQRHMILPPLGLEGQNSTIHYRFCSITPMNEPCW